MALRACVACVLVRLHPSVHQKKKFGIPSLLLKCVMDKDTEIAEVIDAYYIYQVWQIQVGSISSGYSLISSNGPAWLSPRKELTGTFPCSSAAGRRLFVTNRERHF